MNDHHTKTVDAAAAHADHYDDWSRPQAPEPPFTISRMVELAHRQALKSGWWEGVEPGDESVVPEKLMLIVSEASEALEDYRNGEMGLDIIAETGKPVSFQSELADILIRVADLCAHLGVDLERAVRLKMDYNATRPYRHGGKRA